MAESKGCIMRTKRVLKAQKEQEEEKENNRYNQGVRSRHGQNKEEKSRGFMCIYHVYNETKIRKNKN